MIINIIDLVAKRYYNKIVAKKNKGDEDGKELAIRITKSKRDNSSRGSRQG